MNETGVARWLTEAGRQTLETARSVLLPTLLARALEGRQMGDLGGYEVGKTGMSVPLRNLRESVQ